MKRILLTGSNGLLGQNLLKLLLEKDGLEILACSRSKNVYPSLSGYKFTQLDVTDRPHVLDVVNEFNPDVIIHAAAMTQVDPCETEPDLATKINVEGTRNMGDASVIVGARFIYISTDFVFDGSDGPYVEDSRVNPVSHYGLTKLEGENITKCLLAPWAIVRTILVYGVTPAMSRSNLVLWVKKSLEQGQAIRVVHDQYRMPTLVDDLAWAVIRIMDTNSTGVFHISGNELQSVHDLAIQTARFFNLDESLISPISSAELNEIGKRPVKTGFILDKSKKELGYCPKSFIEGLAVVRNLLEEY